MSTRRDINEKPRVTVSEIIEQDKIIRHGFVTRIGEPTPIPIKSSMWVPAGASPPDKYVEERVAKLINEFARNGLKLKYLNRRQRDEWHKEYEYGMADFIEGEEPSLQQLEDIKWDAYCILIGIPVASRIGNMFRMLPDDRHPPKEWPIEVIASVTSGKLLCKDLAEFVEFMIWFTGGWPDTFAGELDKNKSHRLLTQCAGQSLQAQWGAMPGQKGISRLPTAQDVAHVTPANQFIAARAVLSVYPATIKVVPANFTELMTLSGVK